MDPQIARYFASNGYNLDNIGGAAPVDRGMLAQAVMAQQGMPPPQQGPMMGGAMNLNNMPMNERGEVWSGGRLVGMMPGAGAGGSGSGLYNSSEDRGSYDPAGYGEFGPTGMNSPVGSLNPFSEGASTGRGFVDTSSQAFAGRGGGREGFGNAISVNQTTPTFGSPAQSQYGSSTFAQPGATPVTTSTFSPPGKTDLREFNVTDIPIQGSAPIVPGWSPGSALPPGWGPATPGGTPIDNNDIIASIMGAVNTAPPSGGRSSPLGTFATGPDPNAPGSSGFNTGGISPTGFGGIADPGGYGGFGAFGGFSGNAGGWGGGFEGSGFNSGGDYSGGYDTAAGAPG